MGKHARHFLLSHSARASLPYSYWRHHGIFLNIHTAVRPSDDVCKSGREASMHYVIKKPAFYRKTTL